MSKADSGDGSCREILTGKHAGKWRVQFTYVSDSGRKIRVSKILRTKQEAKNLLQAYRKGHKIAEAVREREVTFGEWYEWLADNDWPETLASVTVAQRRSRFRKYGAAHFAHMPLSKIDALKVRAFYRELRRLGASDTLILTIKSDLVRAFNQAISPYGQVPASRANPFRLSLPQPTPRDAIALTPQQARDALKQSGLGASRRAFLGLLLLAGLRLGEVMAITRGQLRFEADLIVIDRAVRVEFGGKQSVGKPKGGKTRNVVMCFSLKRILQDLTGGMNVEDLLFPAATENKPRMKKLVYATWRTIVKDAKLPADMSPHDCRLTHINIIEKLMPNVSPTTLKEHVGHAASGVTEANYTRPLSSAQAILRDELERVLGETKKRLTGR